MPNTRYDIVLFGATGFTGRRAAAYLAAETARAKLSFAVAGRDRARLEELAASLAGEVGVIVADGTDPAAARALAARARVVASTAGPFATYSDRVVDACVETGAHYTDITGETPWVRGLIARHHETAAQRGLRLVPLCGFDSVPADLGTLMLVDHVRRTTGAGCRGVRAFYSLRGGLNGGTVASAMQMAQQSRQLMDPSLLEPPGSSRPKNPRPASAPAFEPVIGRWAVPFFMAPVNTAVVRRSAALCSAWGEPYEGTSAEGFSYDERLLTGGRLAATSMTLGMGMTFALMATGLGRALVRRLAPAPGAGPSEAAVAGGFFRTRLIAEIRDGKTAQAVVSGDGDPGNHATVRFLGQAALALAGDPAALPGGAARGGVLTPATAFGLPWLETLRHAGFRFDVET